MKLLYVLAFAVCLPAQTWQCVTVSGGTPTITPTSTQVCPYNNTSAYFTQTAAYSVAAWNSHLGANSWGPTAVSVSGQGECNEPSGSGSVQSQFPTFQPQTSSQNNVCTWYVVVTSYVNVGGSIEPSVSSQGQTSNIPCAPCSCSASDCSYPPAKAACGCVCSSS